jgi:hypothetical protein
MLELNCWQCRETPLKTQKIVAKIMLSQHVMSSLVLFWSISYCLGVILHEGKIPHCAPTVAKLTGVLHSGTLRNLLCNSTSEGHPCAQRILAKVAIAYLSGKWFRNRGCLASYHCAKSQTEQGSSELTPDVIVLHCEECTLTPPLGPQTLPTVHKSWTCLVNVFKRPGQ